MYAKKRTGNVFSLFRVFAQTTLFNTCYTSVCYSKRTSRYQDALRGTRELNSPSLTVVVFIDDCHVGPIKELHDVLISDVEQTLCGIEINAEFLRLRVQVQPGFEMWDVESVADTVNVLAQNRVRGPEDRLDAVLDLLTRCNSERQACFSAKIVSDTVQGYCDAFCHFTAKHNLVIKL